MEALGRVHLLWFQELTKHTLPGPEPDLTQNLGRNKPGNDKKAAGPHHDASVSQISLRRKNHGVVGPS